MPFDPTKPPARKAGPRGGPRPGQRPKGPRGPGPRPQRDRADLVVLYGIHPVVEALRNPARKPVRLLATENAARRLAELVPDLALQPEIVRPSEIDRLLTPDAVHQGLYLEARPLRAPALDALPADGLVLVLDQITDPHNVGAMLRSACAFGVDAVITTNRHSPEATGVLAKSASGALEHVPIVEVRNLGDALEQLGRCGYRRVGLDSEASESLDAVDLARPLALVLGAEGKGLRQKTRTLCDAMARLELPGAIRSLNVSNATVLALDAARRANIKA